MQIYFRVKFAQTKSQKKKTRVYISFSLINHMQSQTNRHKRYTLR